MRIRSFFRYLSVFLAAMVLCACPAVDPAGPDRPDNPDNPDVPPSPSRDYFRLMINLATPVPDDYEIVTLRDGKEYFKVDETIYRMTVSEGNQVIAYVPDDGRESNADH